MLRWPTRRAETEFFVSFVTFCRFNRHRVEKWLAIEAAMKAAKVTADRAYPKWAIPSFSAAILANSTNHGIHGIHGKKEP